MSNIRLCWLLLALTACSSGGAAGPYEGNPLPPPPPNPPPPPPPPGPNPLQGSVAMESSEDGYGSTTFSFKPSEVAIARTGTITWTNESGTGHNVTFASTTGAPTNIPAYTSGSSSRTFNTAGTFNYQCTLHSGMSGKVIVE
jgi:plastocyanin